MNTFESEGVTKKRFCVLCVMKLLDGRTSATGSVAKMVPTSEADLEDELYRQSMMLVRLTVAVSHSWHLLTDYMDMNYSKNLCLLRTFYDQS